MLQVWIASRRSVVRLFVAGLCLTSVAASAQLNEADRRQRCTNNSERMIALQAEIAATWNDEKIALARLVVENLGIYQARIRFLKNPITDEFSQGDESRIAAIEQQMRDEARLINVQCDPNLDRTTCWQRLAPAIRRYIAEAEADRPRLRELERQYAAHRTNLVALQCGQAVTSLSPSGEPGGAAVDFAGTYTNDQGSTITISGGGGSWTAYDEWATGGRNGSNNWSSCGASGNTLTCNWTGTYLGDPDKTADRSGTLTVSSDGNSLTGSYYENAPDFHWNVAPYASSMREGAVWPINHTRTR